MMARPLSIGSGTGDQWQCVEGGPKLAVADTK